MTNDDKCRYAERRELEAEIEKLKEKVRRLHRQIELKSNYCDRKHAFCPDCRDKLPDNFCWRCEAQSVKAQNAKMRNFVCLLAAQEKITISKANELLGNVSIAETRRAIRSRR